MSAKTPTTDEFILKAIALHGNKYGYGLVIYVHSKFEVTIICPEHGAFEQTPNNHLSGSGCRQRGYKFRGPSKFIQGEK